MREESISRKPQPLSLKKMYKKPGALIVTAAIVVLGVVLGIMFLLPKGERVNSEGYQVVYTASGQAYFGKLKNTTGEYLVLDTPYTAQDVNNEGENAQSSTTLLQVSKQKYGPEDTMSIKSDQVLFWQNLRDDSKVTQAIKSDK